MNDPQHAPVTEAHMKLAEKILFGAEYGGGVRNPGRTAQLIADAQRDAVTEQAASLNGQIEKLNRVIADLQAGQALAVAEGRLDGVEEIALRYKLRGYREPEIVTAYMAELQAAVTRLKGEAGK